MWAFVLAASTGFPTRGSRSLKERVESTLGQVESALDAVLGQELDLEIKPHTGEPLDLDKEAQKAKAKVDELTTMLAKQTSVNGECVHFQQSGKCPEQVSLDMMSQKCEAFFFLDAELNTYLKYNYNTHKLLNYNNIQHYKQLKSLK